MADAFGIMKKNFERRTAFRYMTKHACDPVIYALVNEKKKKAYIASTSNFIVGLARLLSSLSDGSHRSRELRREKLQLSLRLLEVLPDARLGDAYKIKHINAFKDMGYSIYNPERVARYSRRVGFSAGALPQVQVISAGKRILPVKDFRTLEEAEAFLASSTIEENIIMAKERFL